MTVIVTQEKPRGSSQAPTVPYHVYDAAILEDPSTVLSIGDAVDAVALVADISFQGVPDDGDPNFEQLSSAAWRIHVNYRTQSLQPLGSLSVGQRRAEFAIQTKPKAVWFAPEVARFAHLEGAETIGDVLLPSSGIVNIRESGYDNYTSGVVLDPPVANLRDFSVHDPADITAAFRRTLALLIEPGAVNSATLTSAAYAVGEIMLVSAVGAFLDNGRFGIHWGWSYQENVVDEVRYQWDPATLAVIEGYTVDRNGHDYAWDKLERFSAVPGGGVQTEIGITPVGTYVHRVLPYLDLSIVGIEPP
jgi:hypothetical protein